MAQIGVPMRSSFIQELVYDEPRKALTVRFRTGNEAKFRGVSREMFEKFSNAESPGEFYHRHIRDRF